MHTIGLVRHLSSLAVLATALLVACGGGGGGDDSASTTTTLTKTPTYTFAVETSASTYLINPAATWKTIQSDPDGNLGPVVTIDLTKLGAAAGTVLSVQAQGFYDAAPLDKTPQIVNNMSATFANGAGAIVPLPAGSGFAGATNGLREAPTSTVDPYAGDFLIPSTAALLTVPAGAVQLRLSVDDCFFSDNKPVTSDPLRLVIKKAS